MQERNLPFGEDGEVLGGSAADLLGSLCIERPSEQSERWQREDSASIRHLVNIERNLWLSRGLQGSSIYHLHKYTEDFHTALPFTEGERGMVLRAAGVTHEYLPDVNDEILPWLQAKEELVVCAGLRHVIHGRNLAHRWLSWRQETGEYEGQGSLDVAREALRDLIHLVTPEQPLPESYRALRQHSDP